MWKSVMLTAAISKEQMEALKKVEQRTGMSRSKLVRQAVNLILGVYRTDEKTEVKTLD